MKHRIQHMLHKALPSLIPSPVPGLIERLKLDGHRRAEAVRTLGRIHPPIVPLLAKQLGSAEEPLRLQAADDLAEIGPRAIGAVSALVERLDADDEDLFDALTFALRKIDPRGVRVVPLLIRAIETQGGALRRGAVDLTREFHPDAEQIVPPLLKALDDESELTRLAAAGALGVFGQEAQDAAPRLLAALGDDSEMVRDEVARALGFVDGLDERTVPDLIERLERSEKSEIREGAAKALMRINPRNKNALPSLVRALKDKARIVHRAAALALAEISPDAALVTPMLVDTLRVECETIRSEFGDNSSFAALEELPDIAKAARQGSEKTRLAAVEALRVTGILGANLEDEIYDARAGGEDDLILLPLAEALEGGSLAVREAAARAMGEIGPETELAYLSLINSLDDPNESVREEAIRALDCSMESRGDIAALLSSLLEDGSETKRMAVEKALLKVSESAVPGD